MPLPPGSFAVRALNQHWTHAPFATCILMNYSHVRAVQLRRAIERSEVCRTRFAEHPLSRRNCSRTRIAKSGDGGEADRSTVIRAFCSLGELYDFRNAAAVTAVSAHYRSSFASLFIAAKLQPRPDTTESTQEIAPLNLTAVASV